MSPARRTLLLFLLFQALYALTSSGNVFRTPDEFEVYFQTEHFVDAGDLSIPQTLAIVQPVVKDGRVVGRQSVFFGRFGVDRKPYAPYGPLAAILALPHHLLGRAIAWSAGMRRAPLPGGIAWLTVVGGITMLATATAAALAVAGFHRAALTLGASPANALLLSVLLGGATVLWPYGTSFFSEAFQAAAFVWSAELLIEGSVILPASLIVVAGLTEVTSLIFAPAFVVAVLAYADIPWHARAKAAIALTVAIAVAVGAHLTWNAFRFGSALDFGYDWAETIPALPARPFLLADIPRGLAVLLGSPGKSVILWAPVTILSMLGFRAFWKTHRAVAVGVLTTTTAGLLVFAAYLFPEGGYSHGPRNLVPILPLIVLPATAIDVAGQRRALAAICGAIGFVVALAATSVSYLDDQSIGADLGGGARTNYYERVAPVPGRAFNRYRLGYIPFAETFETPGWLHAAAVGQGPDYFPLHLRQARQQLPDGPSIPWWLPGILPAGCLTLLIGSALRLYTD